MSILDCPRCGGQILCNYEEEFCLQCGYEPPPPAGVSALTTLLSKVLPSNDIPEFSRSFSDKPSQIRRRKRRLQKAGYSEYDIERIIRMQTDPKN